MVVPISVISAFIGGLVGFVASFALYFKRNRDRKERLKNSLRMELLMMRGHIEPWAKVITGGPQGDSTNAPVLDADPIITQVYDSNATDIGGFDRSTTEPLTKAYSTAALVRRQMRSVNSNTNTTPHTLVSLLENVCRLYVELNLAIQEISDDEEDIEYSWPDFGTGHVDSERIHEEVTQNWGFQDYQIIAQGQDYEVENVVPKNVGSTVN